MSKEFNGYVHSFVMFEPKHGLEVGSFEGPCAIVHYTGDRVWVAATYSDLPFCKEIDGVQVGDGLSKGFDEQGNCVVSISCKHVTSYLDDEEAENVARCMQADQQLLRYAQ